MLAHWTTDVLAGLAMGALIERCLRPRSERRIDGGTHQGYVDRARSGGWPEMISMALCSSRTGSRSPCFANITIVCARVSAVGRCDRWRLSA